MKQDDDDEYDPGAALIAGFVIFVVVILFGQLIQYLASNGYFGG